MGNKIQPLSQERIMEIQNSVYNPAEEMDRIMKGMYFPEEFKESMISETLIQDALLSVTCANCMTTEEEFETLKAKPVSDYNMQDWGTVLNAIDHLILKGLENRKGLFELTEDQKVFYYQLEKAQTAMASKWNEIWKPYREEIRQKVKESEARVQGLIRREQATTGKRKKPNKRKKGKR